ncbi:MAG: SAM-dependent methyltransferase [Gammaproteobacteria bacterium]
MSRRRIAKSAQWRRARENDPQVRAARAGGFRSRAAFKLMEMDDALRLFFPGARVADLGGAPGGWSQVAAMRCRGGAVVAADISPMSPPAGVSFVRGDFLSAATARAVTDALGGPADVVLSDMSPNISGIVASDQARAAELARAAAAFARENLSPGGKLLVKGFQGREFDEVRRDFARDFAETRIFRPRATRRASREAYIFASGAKKG